MRGGIARRIMLPAGFVLCLGMATGAAGFFAPHTGEYLCFRVSLGPFTLGEQHITAKQAKTEDGRAAILFEQTLDSSPSVARLVDYHERRTFLWDIERLLPLYEEASITQGKKTEYERVDFMPAQGMAMVTKKDAAGRSWTATRSCSAGTQSGSSLLIYLRTFPWERGEASIPLLGGQGTEWYAFTVAEENRTKEVPYGRFDLTYHLSNRDLKYDVWFTRDSAHLPLEIKSQLAVGVARFSLAEARNYEQP